MLFQRLGGLQVQVQETLTSLRELGVAAKLFDTVNDRLVDFDVIHVFGAINGNYRIVEAAKDANCSVVISPILHPPLSRIEGKIARFCDTLTGRLTKWSFHTSYHQIQAGLKKADVIVALGLAERDLMIEGFNADPEKIRIVPNGVARRFFDANETPFRQHSGINGRFALQVSSISPYKNQLSGIRALIDEDIQYVMIGSCAPEHQPYLERCLKAGKGAVHYAGAFPADSSLLASAYAAAEVHVLPSQSEVMPLVVLEALAAGTPVVMTKHSSLKFREAGPRVIEIAPKDERAIASAVRQVVAAGADRASCQALVEHYTWQNVAERIKSIYEEILSDSNP